MGPAEEENEEVGEAEFCSTTRVALTARQFPGLRPAFCVEEGTHVSAGDILFTDRRRPAIRFVAPTAGTVQRIEYGPSRTLGALVLDVDPARDTPPPVAPKENLRETLLTHGLWSSFRTRPFGHIPDPDALPDAIFVLALRRDPAAPDPAAVIAPEAARFAETVSRLTELTKGLVWLCQHEGPALAREAGRIRISRSGKRPADTLPAAHLRRHKSVADGGTVWTIPYADVLTIGRLLETGQYDPRLVVRIDGPLVARPREFSLLLGADLREIAHVEARPDAGTVRILAGPPGAASEAAWLGPDDQCVTLSAAKPFQRDGGATWLGRQARPRPRPILATDQLDAALPRGLHAVPLMRALAIGDAETAQKLGVLDLLEEDVARLSTCCASGMDYRPLLRGVLDHLEMET